MRGNAAKFPDKRISAAAARASLVRLLCGTTDKMLASFTAEGLARRYRVRLGDIETMLENERERRRARAAPSAERLGEAIAYTRAVRCLDSITCYDLAAKFSLWPGTAETVISKEIERRANG